MIKLIIQIPCLNEAETLPGHAARSAAAIPGIDVIEWLVDRRRVARRHRRTWRAPAASITSSASGARKGLAAAFTAGIDAALKLGADYIVNTDADNQYAGGDIALLVAPLLDGEADICIGDRNIQAIAHMSPSKKLLQRLGSWVVRQVSGTQVPDTTSGFRAYTREAALRMTIVSEFSYTLESIIQAGKQRMAIAHVEVRTNAGDARVAALRQHLRLHQALGGDHRPHLRLLRAAQGLLVHRRHRSSLAGLVHLAALPLLLL